MNPDSLHKTLAEPHAFALITWPAVIALLARPDWPLWAQIVVGAWLALMQIAAYTRGAGFGNAMLLSSGLIALAVHYHPSAWTLLVLPALLITLSASQRILLKKQAQETG
jgi:hypothetical protein